ncbi:hypothetical protein LTR53_009600 [Teratosphaeriaceae sp. CCFEE 6253]|nr:hypothetical protein LTR53_009600 [Teratosphaeriaceae sp. CCFEE 6253]
MAVERYDIVIVGAGPVGLLLSTCLARWGYKIKHIDMRPIPTVTGRADGIQPRSLDLLRNMGLKRAIMAHEPAKVYEVAFWDPAEASKGIHRTGTWASCPKFIDARYPFTTLLHQGLIERVFIADLEKNGVKIQRPWRITGFSTDGVDKQYPVEVNIAHVDGDEQETVRTKYLFSGEGARSFVREQLGVGITHKDPIAHVWGVMDGVVRTNFPDIKMKCTIHSDAGSIMVIPREANMVRLYIQVASSTDADWNPRKTATTEQVQEAAKKIMAPYWLEWDRVEWFSVYPIGQGIADRYTLDERVFMGGDCCHTHSPKAGQGMNTAFLDAQNLAWKIHHVESGFADRSILKSYESERKLIAENLLNFDSQYAKLFSQRQPSAGEVGDASKHASDGEQVDENEFIKMFKASCEFTSGYGVAYNENILNWSESHPAQSSLFLSQKAGSTTQRPGRILSPATVTRVADANVVHLEQEIPLNGSYRIYLFAGKPSTTKKAVDDFAANLKKKGSFFSAYARPDAEQVSYHERHNPHSLFFTINTVFNAPRPDIEVRSLLPELLARYFDHVYADDIWDQRVPDAKAAAHAKMGLSEDEGGVVIVRPDGYVGCAVKLVEGSGTVDALNEYFAAFCTKKSLGDVPRVMGDLSRKSSQQPLLSPDTTSLTSFPDPSTSSLNGASSAAPLHFLLDNAGPSFFDEQATDSSTQPQTLARAPDDVLSAVVKRNGANALVRRLATLLAERDAHITALTRLAEEYKVPRQRIYETTSRVWQAEQRRQALHEAANESQASIRPASDKQPKPVSIEDDVDAGNTLTRLFGGGTIRARRKSPTTSTRSTSRAPTLTKKRTESIASVQSADSGGWAASLFGGSYMTRRDSPVTREPVELATQHDRDQLPPTLLDNRQDPHEAAWNKFLLSISKARSKSGQQGQSNGAGLVGSLVGQQKMKALSHLLISGVPMHLRQHIWMELSSAESIMEPGAYDAFRSNTTTADPEETNVIVSDVPRTLTHSHSFYTNKGFARLKEVLVAFVAKYDDLGYTQGLNSIAGYLLLAIPQSEDAFWMLCNMVDHYFPEGYFARETSLTGPLADVIVLRSYIKELMPQLAKHMDDLNIDPQHTVPVRWFFTAFSNVLGEEALMRVWDVWLCLPGQKTFLFNVALAIILQNASGIMGCETEGEYWLYMDDRAKCEVEGDAEWIDKLIRSAVDLRKVLLKVDERRALETKLLRRKAGSCEALYSPDDHADPGREV